MSHEQPHEEILRARATGFPCAGAFALHGVGSHLPMSVGMFGGCLSLGQQ